MDSIITVLGVIIGCGIVGTMTRWYVSGGFTAFGALVRNLDDAASRMMPWPVGVQEEDEVHFHFPATVSRREDELSIEDVPSSPATRSDPRPPTRPQPRTWRTR